MHLKAFCSLVDERSSSLLHLWNWNRRKARKRWQKRKPDIIEIRNGSQHPASVHFVLCIFHVENHVYDSCSNPSFHDTNETSHGLFFFCYFHSVFEEEWFLSLWWFLDTGQLLKGDQSKWFCLWWYYLRYDHPGTFLVVQWLRLISSTRAQVQFLVRELDPTCHNSEFECCN